MTDEEKNLIKRLGYCEQEYEQNNYLSVGKFEAIKEAVNLIEKQSKIIDEILKSWKQDDVRSIAELKKIF